MVANASLEEFQTEEFIVGAMLATLRGEEISFSTRSGSYYFSVYYRHYQSKHILHISRDGGALHPAVSSCNTSESKYIAKHLRVLTKLLNKWGVSPDLNAHVLAFKRYGKRQRDELLISQLSNGLKVTSRRRFVTMQEVSSHAGTI